MNTVINNYTDVKITTSQGENGELIIDINHNPEKISKAIARDIRDPNSLISKALSRSYDLKRKKA